MSGDDERADTAFVEGARPSPAGPAADEPTPPGARDPLGWLGATIDGRIEIQELVGEGGFGVVYRGRHLGFDEPVAVKFLKAPSFLTDVERQALLDEFRTEAKLLHRLSRKTAGIVQALDVGAAASPTNIWAPYIAMEWLDGLSLEAHLLRDAQAARRRSLEEAMGLLGPIAAALAVAHQEGVAHLDVKPPNVFVVNDGTIKLLDFGIAKILAQGETFPGALAKSGAPPALTPAYAAPEQFNQSHGEVGPWSDVFALGLLLIELLSGERALKGANALQCYVAAADDKRRPNLLERGVQVPDGVHQCVRRALAVNPKRRYPGADVMWQALEEAARERAVAFMPTVAGGLDLAAVGLAPRAAASPSARSVGMATDSGTVTGHESGLNRVCTVLSVELLGFDEDESDFEPGELEELCEACMAQVRALIKDNHGTLEAQLGPSLKAVFGQYADGTNPAEGAVQTALGLEQAILRAVSQVVVDELSICARAGICTGRMLVSAVGTTGGYRLAATGAPIKQSEKLQQAAPEGGILIDKDTYRQVAGLVEVELSEPVSIGRGRRSLAAVRVIGPAVDRHQLNAAAARDFCGLETRFVGRAAELEKLATVMDVVRNEPAARLLTLVGTPGVGKTRLLVEVVDRLEADDWVVFTAHASALQTQASYALVAAILRARFHLHDDDTAEVIQEKLDRSLRALRNSGADQDLAVDVDLTMDRFDDVLDVDDVLRQLLVVLGLGHVRRKTMVLDEPESSLETKQIAAAIAAMLRMPRRPVALVCDDVQWADEASLSLLEDLVVRLADAPVLFVCSAQPEIAERRPGWTADEPWLERVDVGPLARRQLEEMARDRLRRVSTLSSETLRSLAERAEGNALTLVETLHLLIDAGAIETSDQAWRIGQDDLTKLTLPTNVQGLVQARLDRLEEVDRRTLTHAAVVGSVFWDGALVACGSDAVDNQDDLGRQLARLCKKGFVRAKPSSSLPDEREYAFAESTVQEVAYEALPNKARRELHGRVAAWLRERLNADSAMSVVAGHFEKAGARRSALDAYRRAGESAARAGQNSEAVHALSRACEIEIELRGEATGQSTTRLGRYSDVPPAELAELVPSERVELLAATGDVLSRMGRYPEAKARYDQASHALSSCSETDLAEPRRVAWQGRLDYRGAVLSAYQGKAAEASEQLETALQRLAEAESAVEHVEMWALLGSMRRREGRLEDARQACLRGVRACRRIGHRDERFPPVVSKILNALGGALFAEGKLVAAERCWLQSGRAIDEGRNPGRASAALNNAAAACYVRGDLEGARESFLRVFKLTQRSGDLQVRTTALANLGEVELALGHPDRAAEFLRKATRLGEQIHAEQDLPEAFRNLARAELARGELAASNAAALRAVELVAKLGAKQYASAVFLTAAVVARDVLGAEGAGPEVLAGARTLAERVEVELSRDSGLLDDEAKRQCMAIASADGSG